MKGPCAGPDPGSDPAHGDSGGSGHGLRSAGCSGSNYFGWERNTWVAAGATNCPFHVKPETIAFPLSRDRKGWVQQLIFGQLPGTSARGQDDLALLRGPGQLPGARGARSAPSQEKLPIGSARDPVGGGSGTATAAGVGDSAFARHRVCRQSGFGFFKALGCTASAGCWRCGLDGGGTDGRQWGAIPETCFSHGVCSQCTF